MSRASLNPRLLLMLLVGLTACAGSEKISKLSEEQTKTFTAFYDSRSLFHETQTASILILAKQELLSEKTVGVVDSLLAKSGQLDPAKCHMVLQGSDLSLEDLPETDSANFLNLGILAKSVEVEIAGAECGTLYKSTTELKKDGTRPVSISQSQNLQNSLGEIFGFQSIASLKFEGVSSEETLKLEDISTFETKTYGRVDVHTSVEVKMEGSKPHVKSTSKYTFPEFKAVLEAEGDSDFGMTGLPFTLNGEKFEIPIRMN